jgi:hypothetical protein
MSFFAQWMAPAPTQNRPTPIVMPRKKLDALVAPISGITTSLSLGM